MNVEIEQKFNESGVVIDDIAHFTIVGKPGDSYYISHSFDLVTWNDILGPMVMSEAGTDTITLSSSEYNEDNDNKSFFRSRFVPAESP